MAGNIPYKKPEGFTTWGDILAIIQQFNQEELESPVATCINGEVFNPKSTIIADKKIELGLIVDKKNKERIIFIGNTEKLSHSNKYTLKFLKSK